MTVELHHAFLWDCDECGTENVFRAIEGDLDEAAMAADDNQIVTALVAPGMAPDDEARPDTDECEVLAQRILLAPRRVTCRACGRSFAADVLGEDDDDA